MDYGGLTDTLNTLISSQQSWENISGGLEKVSESSMGSAWGMSQGKLYSCKLPCTGNWIPDIQNIRDFTTDDSFVYVLSDTLQFKNGNGTGEWTVVPLPTSDTLQKIFSSGSYIWGQGKQKWKLAKPGTTGNWIPSIDTSDVQITSASSSSLYGVDASGKAVKTDESLQSNWNPIPQFKGIFSDILGEQDQSAIYGISGNQVQKCVGDSCTSIQSEPVKNLSVNPNSLWLTSETQGKLGNVYLLEKSQTPDFGTLDKQRDSIVQQTEQDYEQKTYTTMLSDQLKIVTSMFKNLTKNKVDETPAQEATIKVSGQADILEKVLPIIYKIIILMGLLIGVYMCSGFLGSYTHVIALVVFVLGVFYYLLND